MANTNFPTGSIAITSGLGVTISTDTYPTHYDFLGQGGLHTVADLTARNAITTARRSWGMVAILESDGGKYVLANVGMGGVNTDITDNANWISLFTDTGITSLNGLTGTTQTFATGTTGSDFGISSVGTAHTFNIPTASATVRGLLSTTDWSAFSGKGNAQTANPLSQFASTTSAQLAGVISDETGYTVGALLVFDTNPTLSGLTLANSTDIALGTITGSKIGTATSQKLAFWNSTPIAQPTVAVSPATLVSNPGTVITSEDTFGGYTLQQVVQALKSIGLLA